MWKWYRRKYERKENNKIVIVMKKMILINNIMSINEMKKREKKISSNIMKIAKMACQMKAWKMKMTK